MTDQTTASGVDGERGITPVSGPVDGSGRALAKRGIGAATLIAFSVLVIWSTWKAEKPVEQGGAKPIIRQTTTFEPAREPPAPPASCTAGAWWQGSLHAPSAESIGCRR